MKVGYSTAANFQVHTTKKMMDLSELNRPTKKLDRFSCQNDKKGHREETIVLVNEIQER